MTPLLRWQQGKYLHSAGAAGQIFSVPNKYLHVTHFIFEFPHSSCTRHGARCCTTHIPHLMDITRIMKCICYLHLWFRWNWCFIAILHAFSGVYPSGHHNNVLIIDSISDHLQETRGTFSGILSLCCCHHSPIHEYWLELQSFHNHGEVDMKLGRLHNYHKRWAL